jgi:hypothetical protein
MRFSHLFFFLTSNFIKLISKYHLFFILTLYNINNKYLRSKFMAIGFIGLGNLGTAITTRLSHLVMNIGSL